MVSANSFVWMRNDVAALATPTMQPSRIPVYQGSRSADRSHKSCAELYAPLLRPVTQALRKGARSHLLGLWWFDPHVAVFDTLDKIAWIKLPEIRRNLKQIWGLRPFLDS